MSNEYSIKVESVSKMYKMYKSNLAKIADLLGLSFNKNYREFWSLKDINLTIRKGEKVGIIGRNGAGKTTLLSMIADTIKPTTGTITVYGKVNALFVLGTGFHPEFSGKENIYSSLAFQGITGHEAKELEKEIVEFSELEGFIEQPVKTYSAGMYARLAFTVATAIKPEILIIDEVLGAGDAYFNAKAVERMKQLTSDGTTVLFVSHDLSGIQQLCDRCLWIKNGIVAADGDVLEVTKEYLFEVRNEEEARLQSKNIGISKQSFHHPDETQQIFLRFLTQSMAAPEKGFPLHFLRIASEGKTLAELAIGSEGDDVEKNLYVATDKGCFNWSEAYQLEGKCCRDFVDIGGQFVHALLILNIDIKLLSTLEKLDFEIEFFDSLKQVYTFDIYIDDEYKSITTIETNNTQQWKKQNFNYVLNEESEMIVPKLTEMERSQVLGNDVTGQTNKNIDIYGTGEVAIEKFQILNKDLQESYVYVVNDELRFRIYYQSYKMVTLPVFVIAIYSLDGHTIAQLISKENEFDIESLGTTGYVDFVIPEIKIGAGEYIVSIAIFHDVELLNPIEPIAYSLHDRKYTFKIEQPFGINMDLGLVYQDFKMLHRVING